MLAMVQAVALLVAIAPSSSPLEGCAAQSAERGWTYKCKSFVVSIDDSEVEPALRWRAFDEVIGGIAGTGKVRRTAQRRLLGGVTVDVVQMDVEATGARLVAAVVPMSHGSRMLACRPSEPGPDRCSEVLDVLASVPWRSGPIAGSIVQREAAAIALAGREVQIPQGCQGQPQSIRGAGISCASGNWVKWQSTSQEVVGPLMEKWETLNAQEVRRQQLSLSKDTIPCRIAGVPTQCRRFRVAAETEYAITELIGAAQVNDSYLLAMCYSRDSAGPSIPCSLVIDLK